MIASHHAQAHDQTTEVTSLLTTDGNRFIIPSAIGNFLRFTPVGVILVAMMGVGLAEEARLIKVCHAIIWRNA